MPLELSVNQTNDAKKVYLTDISIWSDGSGLPFDWSDVTSASLTIAYNTTENKDFDNPIVPSTSPIDITSIFIGASSQSDLVFELNSDNLGLGADIVIPDGIWKIAYYVTNGIDSSTLNIEVKLDQNIRNGLYKQFANIPLIDFCNCKNSTKTVDDLILALGLLWSTDEASTIARKANILDIQETLKRLIESLE